MKNFPLNDFIVPWNKTHAYVTGLHGDTTYIISVIPLHGLTVKEIPENNEERIIITTQSEPGTQLSHGGQNFS